jgi:hypothetical protein
MKTKRSTHELILEMRYKGEEAALPIDTSVLALEKGAPFKFEDLNVCEAPRATMDLVHVPHPMEGYWSLICFGSDGDYSPNLGLAHFVLSVAPDGSITGSGEAYLGPLKLTGTSISSGEGFPISVDLKMIVDNADSDYTFHGAHNPKRDTVTGSWDKVERTQESAPEATLAVTDAVGEQELVPDTFAQDTDPVQEAIVPNDNSGNSVDASKKSEPDVSLAGVDAQQIDVADVPTNEVVIGDESNGQANKMTPTQAGTAVEDVQTSTVPENIANGEQGPASYSSMHDNTVSVLENNHHRQTTNAAELSDDKNSAESGDPGISEPNEDTKASHVAAENAVGMQGADDSNVQDGGSPRVLGTFSMRRTPADMHRFRRRFNLDRVADPSVMAKNRWKFAIEAIRFQIQAKNMSWEHVRARFAERKLWQDLAVAFWRGLLPTDRLDLMCALTVEYAPSQSRLYEAIANFLNNRGYPFKT